MQYRKTLHVLNRLNAAEWMIRMKKTVLLSIIVLLVFSLAAFPAEAECVEVYSFENLYEAVTNGWADEIRLMNSIDVYSTITLHPGRNLTITAVNPGAILSHWEYSGPMFVIPEGSSLTIKGDEGAEITLSGAANTAEENSCIAAEGSFTAEHVIISSFSGDTGAAVCLPDGNGGDAGFTARFTTLQNCRARCGGAVYIGEGRRAEISSTVFTGNSATEAGASIYAAGALVFGDNNRVEDATGPMNYAEDGNGGFVFGESICGSGSFEKSWRTDVNGVVSWGGGAEPPDAVEVILLANGTEAERQSVRCGANGYWEFSFKDLPIYAFGAPVAYDIGEYSIDGLRFDKRGEADVGFEILYSPGQMSSEYVQMLLEGESAPQEYPEETAQEAEPVPPEETFEYNNPVTVTKSPTGETVMAGGRTDFVARADNCTDITWHFISPDDSMNLTGIEAVMYLNGKASFYELNTERLTLTDISAEMDGWKFQAEFAGNGGPVFSECAVLNVYTEDIASAKTEHAEQVIAEYFAAEEQKALAEPTPEPVPEPTPEPTPVPTPEPTPVPELPLDENIVITKQPSGETVKENGSAIFIAKAENCKDVLWHIISPEGSVDYAGEEILSAFGDVQIEGIDDEKIKIKNIPVAMSGWGFAADFISENGHKLSEKAVITLEGYEQTEVQEVPEVEETPTMMLAAAPAALETEETDNGAETVESAAAALPVEAAPVEATAVPVAIPTETPAQTAQTAPEQQAMQSITVTAQWLDNADAAGNRPEGTIVQLFRDGSLYFTASLSEGNDWSYTFTNLNGGNYRVQESGVANYAQNYSVNGNTITIQHTYIGAAPQQLASANPAQMSAPVATPAPAGNGAPAATPTPAAQATPAPTAAPAGNPASQPQEAINALDGDGSFRFTSHSTSNIITLAAIAAAIAAIIALAAVILIKNNRRRY